MLLLYAFEFFFLSYVFNFSLVLFFFVMVCFFIVLFFFMSLIGRPNLSCFNCWKNEIFNNVYELNSSGD